MDSEVLGHLLDRHPRAAVPRDPHDVLAELFRIRLGHSDILPTRPTGQASSDVTRSCGRPQAVAKLAAAITRLDTHRFPLILTDPVREFLEGVADFTGIPFDERDPEAAVARLGNLARMIGATLRDTANVTMFNAGYKGNVVPSLAQATVDARVLPGREEAFKAEAAEVLGPDIECEWQGTPSVQTTFDGALVDAMAGAIGAEDPGARVLPYMLSAGTDAKSFQRLGIRHFGFAPLRLPAELDFSSLFHGVNERVPVEALEFGTRVLDRLLRTC
ncbi:M20/M25/M40 family metallo-hydrolase [Streptomyces sp. NPDC002516]